MAFYVIKVVISAVFIVLISEISRRNTTVGAILASIPLISVLAIIWIYVETKDIPRIVTLSSEILLLVIPSLAFFIALPILLKIGIPFYISLTISMVITVGCYWAMISISGQIINS